MRMKSKTRLLLVMLASLCISGCGGNKAQINSLSSPEETVESAMNAIKALDMETLNSVSDNYVRTWRNWMGAPAKKEYRVFNELLQPGFLKGRRYQSNKAVDQKMVEALSWEINDIREKGDLAEIDLTVTNKDLRDVTGYLEMEMLKEMVEGKGTGVGRLLREMPTQEKCNQKLISYMEKSKELRSVEVTVMARKGEEGWKIHLDRNFINAFLGNFMSQSYSPEVEEQLEKLEEEYEDKIEHWSDEFSEKVENWADKFSEDAEDWSEDFSYRWQLYGE